MGTYGGGSQVNSKTSNNGSSTLSPIYTAPADGWGIASITSSTGTGLYFTCDGRDIGMFPASVTGSTSAYAANDVYVPPGAILAVVRTSGSWSAVVTEFKNNS